MRCPSCHHHNRDVAKFCEECAAPLGSDIMTGREWRSNGTELA
jgi:predicted amidophosphoribosyltransferase